MECREWPEALSAARHAYVLAPPVDDLLHALKYEGWPELAGLMGDELARVDVPEPPGNGRLVVVPIPTTEARVRSRGYNQARLIADRLAGARGLPLCSALARASARRSQTSLAPSERRANVRGAFSPRRRAAEVVGGSHVLLVDDVLTTGATASEAALALAAAGASSVTLLTFGRALATGSGARS